MMTRLLVQLIHDPEGDGPHVFTPENYPRLDYHVDDRGVLAVEWDEGAMVYPLSNVAYWQVSE